MNTITQAFVLAAGRGTRLRPLTEDLPKPLIPIFQKPLITFALDHLLSAGVRSFVINTHHRPNHFVDFFRTSDRDAKNPVQGSYRNHPVTLQYEPILLGT